MAEMALFLFHDVCVTEVCFRRGHYSLGWRYIPEPGSETGRARAMWCLQTMQDDQAWIRWQERIRAWGIGASAWGGRPRKAWFSDDELLGLIIHVHELKAVPSRSHVIAALVISAVDYCLVERLDRSNPRLRAFPAAVSIPSAGEKISNCPLSSPSGESV